MSLNLNEFHFSVTKAREYAYAIQPIKSLSPKFISLKWGEILCKHSDIYTFGITEWREWYCCIKDILDSSLEAGDFNLYSININSFQLFDPVIIGCLEQMAGYPVCLEWTEEKYLLSDDEFEEAGNFFRNFCSENEFKPVLDDIGRGEDSLRRCFLVSPSAIKMDGQIFQQSKTSPFSKKMFLKYINFYQSMDVPIVLEWIETFEDLLFAESAGIDFGQGFYWDQGDHQKVKIKTGFVKKLPVAQR